MASERRTECPHWEKDFPIKSGEDGYTTRREFTKFLGLTSISFFLGTCWAAGRRWLKQRSAQNAAGMEIAGVGELPVGGYKLFRYPQPESGEPCILLRLDETRYAAYSQSCTHLACPVYFSAAQKQLVCPCHHGFFSADDGRVLAGPPKRALQRYAWEIRGEKIWITGPEKTA